MINNYDDNRLLRSRALVGGTKHPRELGAFICFFFLAIDVPRVFPLANVYSVRSSRSWIFLEIFPTLSIAPFLSPFSFFEFALHKLNCGNNLYVALYIVETQKAKRDAHNLFVKNQCCNNFQELIGQQQFVSFKEKRITITCIN